MLPSFGYGLTEPPGRTGKMDANSAEQIEAAQNSSKMCLTCEHKFCEKYPNITVSIVIAVI